MRYLTLLFLLIIPICSAELCSDYSDCSELDCIGYSRSCVDGVCEYSDCFIDYGMGDREDVPSFQSTLDEYNVQTDNAFGLKPVLVMAGKITILTFVVLLLALLLTVIQTKGAFRFVVIFLMVLIVAFGVVFLFGLQTKFMQMLGLADDSPGGYEGKVIESAKKYSLSVEKRDVTAALNGFLERKVEEGVEYRLYNLEQEFNILLVEHKPGYTLKSAVPEKLASYGKSEGVYSHSENNNKVYLWGNDDKFYFVSGRAGSKVLQDLLMKPQIRSALGIFNLVPENESYTREKWIRFEINEELSPGDVSIGILSPDQQRICNKKAGGLICEFSSSEIKQGWNWMKISVKNEETRANAMYNFYYDTSPPEISTETENATRVSFFSIDFLITDDAGIKPGSIRINTPAKLDFECENIRKNYECIASGAPETEGEIPIELVAEDMAGNRNYKSVNLIYDNTRPSIELVDSGFRIMDKGGIEAGSLMVDNRKYNINDCESIDNGYFCPQVSPSVISVEDNAGNRAVLENRRSRN